MIVRITSKFGEVNNIHPQPHTGIDLAFPEGSPLYTVTNAVVERVVNYGTENIGKGVILRLADGREVIYGHLSEVKVKVGQSLTEGQLIGMSGNTGHSTGPHLHLGLKENGEFIDPAPLAEKMLANGRVGDGIGDIPEFNIWEWLGGKFAEITIDGAVNFSADLALAFPIIAIVSGGVYALLNMVSKRIAKLGAIATMIYGVLIVRGNIL